MKIDKNKAIQIVTKTAKEYDKCLKGHQFLIYYQNGESCEYKEIEFIETNYLHLTGLKAKMSPRQFYKACIEGKLSNRDFEIENNGNAQRKLEVLPHLPELLYNNCMIGEYNRSGVCLCVDYMVGDTKYILSLGIGSKSKGCDYPKSLLKESVKKVSDRPGRVWVIFKRRVGETQYANIAYINKNTDLNKLKLPNKVNLEGLIT